MAAGGSFWKNVGAAPEAAASDGAVVLASGAASAGVSVASSRTTNQPRTVDPQPFFSLMIVFLDVLARPFVPKNRSYAAGAARRNGTGGAAGRRCVEGIEVYSRGPFRRRR